MNIGDGAKRLEFVGIHIHVACLPTFQQAVQIKSSRPFHQFPSGRSVNKPAHNSRLSTQEDWKMTMKAVVGSSWPIHQSQFGCDVSTTNQNSHMPFSAISQEKQLQLGALVQSTHSIWLQRRQTHSKEHSTACN